MLYIDVRVLVGLAAFVTSLATLIRAVRRKP